MNVLAYFQKPEEARAAAAGLRESGRQTSLRDAGQFEDARAFGVIGRGLYLGLAAGLVAGIAIGLVAMHAVASLGLAVVVIAAVALAAFGGLGGFLAASAMAESRRSSGQGLLVTADVEDAKAPEVEEELAAKGASVVERRPRLS